MEVHHGNLNEMESLQSPVGLTIGNFDGVHRGHQALIRRLVGVAKERGLQSAVLCFEPHPDLVFNTPDFHILMTSEKKSQSLASLGVDHLILQKFDDSFARVSAKDFLRQYLASYFNLRFLLLGYDFRFGHQGEGGFAMASQFFSSQGVDLEQGEPVVEGGATISSSLIRDLLRRGKVEQAQSHLGHPYGLSGVVIQGQKLGRTIGFPTANLSQIKTLVPGRGVYHCSAEFENQIFPCVVNIGQRPTVQGQQETVEAHLLQFEGDLYGRTLSLSFLQKIRDEQKFENLDKLKEQIIKDIESLKK